MKILIVEDEILIATDLEMTLDDLGHQVVGIAPDRASALSLAAERPDVAFVDVNLRDGQTGPAIGRSLAAEHGVKVVFLTANPALLGSGVNGTLGVMNKPTDERSIAETLDFVCGHAAKAPAGLSLFAAG